METGNRAVALTLALSLQLLAACSAPSPAPCTPEAAPPPPPTAAPAAPAEAPSLAPVSALSLWSETGTKKAIEGFVLRVTDPKSPDFVPEAERIAVFDNDGTLWSEQPMYVQLAFVLDRVKALAPEHPEWKNKEPFRSVLAGDLKALAKMKEKDLLALVTATHSGMSPEEFQEIVLAWMTTARHPKYDRPYADLTYAPMVELLAYLRAHGFRTFIVSGGGAAFMRPWAEAAYGIPRDQIIGSRMKLEWQDDGKNAPALQIAPQLEFVDDGAGKPVGIQHAIGRRPIFAAGNSDGDRQMLEWTASGAGPRLALLVHHTDAQREAAYDRQSSFGKLDQALDQAQEDGWVIVDMKTDWTRVFGFEGAGVGVATKGGP